jgi:hypothetical protein
MVTRRQWVRDENDDGNVVYFIVAMVTKCVYTSLWRDVKQEILGRIYRLLSFDRTCTVQKMKKKIAGTHRQTDSKVIS